MFVAGKKVVHQFAAVDCFLQHFAFFIIAGVSANRCQSVRCQCHKACLGDTPGYVFDIGVEAHGFRESPGRPAMGLKRFSFDQVTVDPTIAVG